MLISEIKVAVNSHTVIKGSQKKYNLTPGRKPGLGGMGGMAGAAGAAGTGSGRPVALGGSGSSDNRAFPKSTYQQDLCQFNYHTAHAYLEFH